MADCLSMVQTQSVIIELCSLPDTAPVVHQSHWHYSGGAGIAYFIFGETYHSSEECSLSNIILLHCILKGELSFATNHRVHTSNEEIFLLPTISLLEFVGMLSNVPFWDGVT